MADRSDDLKDRRTVLKTLTAGAIGATAFAAVGSADSRDEGDVPAPTPPEDRMEPDRIVSDLDEVVDRDEVAASDDCYTRNESKCDGTCGYGYERVYTRECLVCGGGVIDCSEWESTGYCCY